MSPTRIGSEPEIVSSESVATENILHLFFFIATPVFVSLKNHYKTQKERFRKKCVVWDDEERMKKKQNIYVKKNGMNCIFAV